MKMSLKNAIREWVSSLVGIFIVSLVSYKLYFMFDNITFTQAGLVILFYVFGISLIFMKDKDVKKIFNRLMFRK